MKFLLVDDEPGIREGLAALLRLRGHEVRTAGDCAAAIALLQGHDFDLVLTDWRLPDGTGARLYPLGTAPIVAISGHPDEVEASPRLCAVLQKPVLPDRLLAVIAKHAAPVVAAGAVAVAPLPLQALPRDLRAVLERAIALLGPVAAEIVDDGVFVTLRAPWPGDDHLAEFAALGGDLRVLAPGDAPRLDLRWCRDGRPAVDQRTIAAASTWPEHGDFAVDFDTVELTGDDFVAMVERAAAARRRGRSIWFLNVPETMLAELARRGRAADLPVPARIGPLVPEALAELWR